MPREQMRQVAPPAASTTTWAWPGCSDWELWAWAMDWWIDPQLSLFAAEVLAGLRQGG